MAEVYVASTVGAEGFSRKVAIKKVLPGFSDNPQFSQMFIAEAQISSRLVVNQASYKLKRAAIQPLLDRLKKAVK